MSRSMPVRSLSWIHRRFLCSSWSTASRSVRSSGCPGAKHAQRQSDGDQRSTKEMINRCLFYLHAISGAEHAQRQRDGGQPLSDLYLHAINSLVRTSQRDGQPLPILGGGTKEMMVNRRATKEMVNAGPKGWSTQHERDDQPLSNLLHAISLVRASLACHTQPKRLSTAAPKR